MQPTPAISQPTPEHILQFGLAFWGSKVLLTAIELNVFTELAAAPLTQSELTARLGLHPRAARDFFDALVAAGFLERDGNTYGNAPAAGLYLDRNKPGYVGGLLEMCNHRLYPFWGHLTEALRSGRPQNEARDGSAPLFETLYADPARLREFLRAMTAISHGANLAIARQFPWREYRTFADVGTAQGDLAVQIALHNPHLVGVGFDLPKAQPVFDDYLAENGLEGRLQFHAGDFFRDPLPAADVILMGHILHDWGLEAKKELIRKAYAAIPKGGALIVYDSIIDDDRRHNLFGLLMSLNMLIETPEGFDYTGADCQAWMKDAGFARTRLEPLVGPDSMVVGIK
jgi:hypothetical protein